MTDKSVIFRVVKYLLISVIAIFIVLLFVLLIGLIIVTSTDKHENGGDETHVITATTTTQTIATHHTEQSVRHMSHTFIVFVSTLLLIEIGVQIFGLIGVLRENVIILLTYGVLTAIEVLIELVALFTHEGSSLSLVFTTFLAVLTFVFIHVIRNERRSLPRVHYIPAPTNAYNNLNYSYFPQPSLSSRKDSYFNI